jgi:hypothetical protein
MKVWHPVSVLRAKIPLRGLVSMVSINLYLFHGKCTSSTVASLQLHSKLPNHTLYSRDAPMRHNCRVQHGLYVVVLCWPSRSGRIQA